MTCGSAFTTTGPRDHPITENPINPNALKAILLEDATTEQQKEFAKLLAEQCATADRQAKGHVCWTYVPTETEYARMRPYALPPDYDTCRKCNQGRVRVEFYHGNMGIGMTLVCSNVTKKTCDFKEYISDPE